MFSDDAGEDEDMEGLPPARRLKPSGGGAGKPGVGKASGQSGRKGSDDVDEDELRAYELQRAKYGRLVQSAGSLPGPFLLFYFVTVRV